jgi:flagellar basal-body rod protein FlgG
MPASALHVARTGLEAQDTRMRVIANNLANIGTTGFKRDRADFQTLAYQDVRVAGQRAGGEAAYAIGLNLGNGVSVQGTTRINAQGTLNNSANALDLALDGEGLFEVELPGGQLAYTRAGNFTLSAEGQLVTAQGYAVQPAIQVPQGAETIAVGPDGTVTAMLAGDAAPAELGQLTAASGAAEIGVPGLGGRGQIRQGMLEASNVNVVEELVEMIEAQRSYEINSKMISSVDEMLRNVNQTL